MKKALLALPLGVALAGCASKNAAPAATAGASAASDDERTSAKVQAALAGSHRSEKNRARDKWRHPAETLGFFGLLDDMTVVELAPGAGWYTEVLAPVLAERGHLRVTMVDPNGDPNDYNVKRAKEMLALKEQHPDVFGKVEGAIIDPPKSWSLGPAGSADLVVTFRNLHGWLGDGSAEKVAKAAFDVLKPGGVFGVEDHRGKPGSDPKTGYVDEEQAIKLIEGVGFKLAAKSEVNANPKDTKDHENGVWALPPTLRNGDKDRQKYVDIGESDRFTLKFVKP
jgi:predicted methyltransferase